MVESQNYRKKKRCLFFKVTTLSHTIEQFISSSYHNLNSLKNAFTFFANSYPEEKQHRIKRYC